MILLDNTNCQEKPREALILKAREAGYESIALVVMLTPLKTCLKRNKKRSRVVPEDMVRLFHAQMVGKEKPTESEGLIIEARRALMRSICTSRRDCNSSVAWLKSRDALGCASRRSALNKDFYGVAATATPHDGDSK